MAIEIREVVIKATVHKNIGGNKAEFVSKAEMLRMQEKLSARILSRVRELIEDERSFR